jgi:hypothetical protein
MSDTFRTKLNDLLSSLKSLPKRAIGFVARTLFGAINKFIHSLLFSVLMLLFGLSLGFGVGARMFETGQLPGGMVNNKGASVKISGPCRVEGEIRKPALAEDEVKIVSIDDHVLVGVVRATRETVECDLKTTAIDHLPLLKDIGKTPAEIPSIRPFEPTRIDNEVAELRHRTIKASGICDDRAGTQLPPFVDQNIDVIDVQRTDADKTIIRISGILRKTGASVNCTNKGIRYSIIDTPIAQAPSAVVAIAEKRDLVGDIILITSTCFPDKRLPTSRKSKVVFYPLVNARLQVTQSIFDDEGKLTYVAGAIIENGSMVECDSNRYPITYKRYDPSSMKLEKIQDSSSSLETIEPQAPPQQDQQPQ